MAGIVEVDPKEMTFASGVYADKMAASCNLVKVYKSGHTVIRIFDGAYAKKTAADINETIDRLNRTCWKCVEAARAAGQDI